MSDQMEASTSHIPSYAKLIMIVQTLVIAYFAFWTYEEYLNSVYFQDYVNASLQGSGFAIVALSSVGIFTAIAAGLFMKLRRTRQELQHLVSNEPATGAGSASGGVLAPHVEQHLIEMIRKSGSSDSTTAGMPVLKREDQPSGTAK